jgi:hypothetical protein
MPATVIINRLTGAGPTKTDITSIKTRANAHDAHAPTDTTNPIRIPPSGTNYSYWVNTRLEVTGAPDTGIDNIEWYTDGSNNFGTGTGMNVLTATVYSQATGVEGTSGTELTKANYDAGPGTANNDLTDAFSHNAGSPKAVAGSIGASTGDLGDLVVYQLTVISTADPGELDVDETLTFTFDES